ncbi:unnamed protein product [Phyllotreta striolata]|uniref:acid phosphatase n=1 Tax=Phyllotreta striolata TaxID=444603 RepID=A0A9N9TWT9_PHYSR|nr:unnamed protein product [Phyllotreta striolata]
MNIPIITLILCVIGADSYENNTLLAVAVIYRHGDRSPSKSFPNDVYFNETYWPMGFGQLTKEGIARQYELGKWFRRRYNDFLSDNYSPNEIYIHSTNSDRTLMSAYANLAGLYPPAGYQVWSDRINWQPIPVHTEDRSKDDVITDKRRCRAFAKAYGQAKKSANKFFRERYRKLYGFIKDKTGWKDVTLSDVRMLHKNIKIYRQYNRSFVPDWIDHIDAKSLDFLAGLKSYIPVLKTHQARLHIGPFFHRLFQHFDNFVGLTSETPKFLMFSAHDSTLCAILGAMRMFNFRPIGFGDAIMWELRRINGVFVMNVAYKSEEDTLRPLYINGCEFGCDYETFKRSLSDVTVSIQQWKVECKDVD